MDMMLITGKMMMTMLCWNQFAKLVMIQEALQVLHDYMHFSLSTEDIRQKFNALSISIDKDVTAKMTQWHWNIFSMIYIVYFIWISDRIEKKTLITRTIFTYLQKFELSNVSITRTFDNWNYFLGPLEVRVIRISSVFYCIPSMCSLNCVHTLQRSLVAYFPSLFSGTQILAWKGAKDFSIQFFFYSFTFQ